MDRETDLAGGAADGVLEQAICRIATTILQRGEVTPQTNLLRLRVGLRRIVKFLETIETDTGKTCPVLLLTELQSARALARALNAPVPPPLSPLVQLKAGTADRPVFLLCGLGGTAFDLMELATGTQTTRAIYSYQYQGLDGRSVPHHTALEMAKYQAAAIRALQPHGPYTLGGYSWGGVVALETAGLLRDAGEAVSPLLLIEPQLPEPCWTRAARHEFLRRRIRHHARAFKGLPWRDKLRYCAGRAQPVLGRVARMLGSGTSAFSSYHVDGMPPVLTAVREAALAAYYTYTPRAYDGPVFLFRSEHGDPLSCDQLKLWPAYLTAMTVVAVPGDHSAMMRAPHVATLAERLSALLAAEA